MQLSVPTVPAADTTLAATLLGGGAAPTMPADLPAAAVGPFDQLFPGLAPAPSGANGELPASSLVGPSPAPALTPALRSFAPVVTGEAPLNASPILSPSAAASVPAEFDAPAPRSPASAASVLAGKAAPRPSVRPLAAKSPGPVTAEVTSAAAGPRAADVSAVAPQWVANLNPPVDESPDCAPEGADVDLLGSPQPTGGATETTVEESVVSPDGTLPVGYASGPNSISPRPALQPSSPRPSSGRAASVALRPEVRAESTPLNAFGSGSADEGPASIPDESAASPQPAGTAPTTWHRGSVNARQFSSFVTTSASESPAALTADASPAPASMPLTSAVRPSAPDSSPDELRPAMANAVSRPLPFLRTPPSSSFDVSAVPADRAEVAWQRPVGEGSAPLSPFGEASFAKITVGSVATTDSLGRPDSSMQFDRVWSQAPHIPTTTPSDLSRGAATLEALSFRSLPNTEASPADPMTAPALANEVAVTAPPPDVATTSEELLQASFANLSAPSAEAAAPTHSPRSGTALVGAKAKFAAPFPKVAMTRNSVDSAPDKDFQNSEDDVVTVGIKSVGTGVAKSDLVMPAATFTDRPALAAVLPHASLADALRGGETFAVSAPAGLENIPTTESVASAHRAVEAVLVAADRFSSGDRHAVNLQFSVAGTDLNVRVELRADEVRATFRTESPELRHALAHEWQAANSAAAGDRSFRLAPAVFTTGAGDNAGSLSFAGGDSSSRQRDTQSRRSENEVFASLASAARLGRSESSAVAAPAAGPVAARRGSHRLLAHA